ncbi:hypothetical protein N7457_009113, partial [Penicillium paradoxum]|uniref:uncharacterized protein n=1 Tax=Penicillium paradoxum TaxID=176176 RepID=UPI0025491637
CGYAEVLIVSCEISLRSSSYERIILTRYYQLVEWVVPDEQSSLVAERKSTHGRKPAGGDAQCLFHSLDSQGWMCVNLLSLSLVGFTLEDTFTVSSTLDHELHLLSPKPLPINHGSRTRLKKDLGSFVSAYIFDDGPASRAIWGILQNRWESLSETEAKGQVRRLNLIFQIRKASLSSPGPPASPPSLPV